jgi:TRAP-type C4-dicarboxylate transport system permease small subunit
MTERFAALRWLRRRAENVIAALLAIMFVAFLIQIVFRYAFNFPVGWTTELTLMTWLWLVLFGAAFVVRESEEIRFDLVYGAIGRRGRILTTMLTGIFLIALYGMSFPAVLDYVLFMKVQKTSYLDVRFDVLYLIYPVFAAAVIARYGWLLWRAIRGKAPEAFDPTQASSGV